MSGRDLLRHLVVLGSLVAPVLHGVSAAAQTSSKVWRPTIPVGLDLYMPVPERNPMSVAKVALGCRLFFDSLLSRDRTRACATCHDPRHAFTDGRAVAVGVEGRSGTRNVPTLVDRGYGKSFFWDGRAASLEQQALQPIQHRREMDMTLDGVIRRLTQDDEYPGLFRAAFGSEPRSDLLAKAVASYMRTILSGNAPFDRYVMGERDALSALAQQGLLIFAGKGNCTACHIGPTLTDEGFHNTGIAWNNGKLRDSGRYMVSGKDQHRGAFKTPTLREVSRTTPYMHDGSIATLEEVIEFYDRGGKPNPNLDPELRPLNLSAAEKRALLAFLRALSGEIREGTLDAAEKRGG